ncbi:MULTISPECIES: cell division protein FtsL [Paenibacillus]|uniref:Cell division protein FtsL n=1 Tax=Paenibacillus violae TaxID=3077234 RepID=A0ABU3RC53_9BACL|nr:MULTISPECIES: septum formation initiator family protein [Paenibacillus]MDU0201624.1 septum formation initiator family protein [Paenibacillus sp. PFR10]MEC0265630.1 septum formation initiator family protein [Paenibacillus anseongense]
MPSYIQGNLALDRKRTVPAAKVKIKETTKVVYRNKSLPTQEKMLYLFTVLLCVLVAGVIIWRYASIYQMNASILKMQVEIREIQAQNSALKQEVEKLQSPDRLKEEAVRLGFNLDDGKKVSLETPAKSKTSTSSSKNTKVASKP